MHLLFRFKNLRLAAGGLLGLLAGFADAQVIRRVADVDQRIGPDNFLQKSLAFDVWDHTLEFTGVTILGSQYLFKSDVPDTSVREPAFIYQGIYDVTFTRRMPNALAYGVNGRVLTQDPQVGSPTLRLREMTEVRFDVYLRGIWGQLSYGDFDDRDALIITGRNSLTGEANLVFDGYLSASRDRAFRYRARYSSWLVDAAVDDDGRNWDAATQFRTKSGIFERAYSFNYSGGELQERHNRHAFSLGHQLIYGSSDLSMGVTWESLDPQAGGDNFDRLALSLGTSWKREQLTIATGVLLGEVDGGDLGVVATAGLRYDIMRGLSFNLGYIYADTSGRATDGRPLQSAGLSGLRMSMAFRY